MGKLNSIKVLKKTTARTTHICNNCNLEIKPGEIYYREHVEDKFLHSLHEKKFCALCYGKFGKRLLK